MPIIKIIPSKSKISRIESYIKNPNKSNPNDYFGNFCDFDNVAESFQQWNQCFSSQTNKRTYYHIIISFNPKDQISPEQCRQITEELCYRTKLTDYPFFGTVHTNTDHIHSHTIVNNCSIRGKSYQSTRSSTKKLQSIANEICKEYGFQHSVIDIDQKAKNRLTTAEAQIILKKKQLPWKEQLRYQIEESLLLSNTLEEFKINMNELFGIHVSENTKGELRFHTSHAQKPCPARRLGDDYSRKNLTTRLKKNFRKERAIKR